LTIATPKDTMFLYRAMSDIEFFKVIQSKRFACLPGGVGVKYFGLNFQDTLNFADMVINKNIVAIVEVEVSCEIVNKIGDFVNVDPFLFKHGTVEIWETDLNKFNDAIVSVTHKF